jgi:hypothetical protein
LDGYVGAAFGIALFACWTVDIGIEFRHNISELLKSHKNFERRHNSNTYPCFEHSPTDLLFLSQPGNLHVRRLAPCFTQTPPCTIPFVQPATEQRRLRGRMALRPLDEDDAFATPGTAWEN